jgi:hypothetical protein
MWGFLFKDSSFTFKKISLYNTFLFQTNLFWGKTVYLSEF